jgi:hypothetical protein
VSIDALPLCVCVSVVPSPAHHCYAPESMYMLKLLYAALTRAAAAADIAVAAFHRRTSSEGSAQSSAWRS